MRHVVQGLPPVAVLSIYHRLERLHLAAGDILFHSGDDALDGMYVIVSGEVGMCVSLSAQKQLAAGAPSIGGASSLGGVADDDEEALMLLCSFKKAQTVGENALLSSTAFSAADLAGAPAAVPRIVDCTRPVAAVALKDSTVLRLDAALFRWFVDSYPPAVMSFMLTTTTRQWRVALFLLVDFFRLRDAWLVSLEPPAHSPPLVIDDSSAATAPLARDNVAPSGDEDGSRPVLHATEERGEAGWAGCEDCPPLLLRYPPPVRLPLQALRSACTAVLLKQPGEVVYAEGTDADAVFVVLSGDGLCTVAERPTLTGSLHFGLQGQDCAPCSGCRRAGDGGAARTVRAASVTVATGAAAAASGFVVRRVGPGCIAGGQACFVGLPHRDTLTAASPMEVAVFSRHLFAAVARTDVTDFAGAAAAAAEGAGQSRYAAARVSTLVTLALAVARSLVPLLRMFLGLGLQRLWLKAGDALFQAGDAAGDGLYVIISGRMRVLMPRGGGGGGGPHGGGGGSVRRSSSSSGVNRSGGSVRRRQRRTIAERAGVMADGRLPSELAPLGGGDSETDEDDIAAVPESAEDGASARREFNGAATPAAASISGAAVRSAEDSDGSGSSSSSSSGSEFEDLKDSGGRFSGNSEAFAAGNGGIDDDASGLTFHRVESILCMRGGSMLVRPRRSLTRPHRYAASAPAGAGQRGSSSASPAPTPRCGMRGSEAEEAGGVGGGEEGDVDRLGPLRQQQSSPSAAAARRSGGGVQAQLRVSSSFVEQPSSALDLHQQVEESEAHTVSYDGIQHGSSAVSLGADDDDGASRAVRLPRGRREDGDYAGDAGRSFTSYPERAQQQQQRRRSRRGEREEAAAAGSPDTDGPASPSRPRSGSGEYAQNQQQDPAGHYHQQHHHHHHHSHSAGYASRIDVGRGDMVGELAVLAKERRRGNTAVCIRDCELIRISQAAFDLVSARYPAVATHFTQALARRFQDVEARAQGRALPTHHHAHHYHAHAHGGFVGGGLGLASAAAASSGVAHSLVGGISATGVVATAAAASSGLLAGIPGAMSSPLRGGGGGGGTTALSPRRGAGVKGSAGGFGSSTGATAPSPRRPATTEQPLPPHARLLRMPSDAALEALAAEVCGGGSVSTLLMPPAPGAAPYITLAVVPAGGGSGGGGSAPRVSDFCARLVAALERMNEGPVLHLSSQALDAALGRGTAGDLADVLVRARVSAWLSVQEERHRFIVFETDAAPAAGQEAGPAAAAAAAAGEAAAAAAGLWLGSGASCGPPALMARVASLMVAAGQKQQQLEEQARRQQQQQLEQQREEEEEPTPVLTPDEASAAAGASHRMGGGGGISSSHSVLDLAKAAVASSVATARRRVLNLGRGIDSVLRARLGVSPSALLFQHPAPAGAAQQAAEAADARAAAEAAARLRRRASAWSDLCVQQADLVLCVGQAHTDPSLSQVEAECVFKVLPQQQPAVGAAAASSRNSAEAAATSSPVEMGGTAAASFIAQRTYAVKELVLLHPDPSRRPRNTRDWLRRRRVAWHHHVRSVLDGDYDRLARHVCGRARGVVLGGGGSRGLAHLGVLQALEARGVGVDVIGGTSQGAFMAACYAMTLDAAACKPLAGRLADAIGNTFNLLTGATLPILSYFSGASFNDCLLEVFTDTQIEDLWLRYFCISTDVANDCSVVHHTGPLWRYCRASMTVMGLLPPLVDRGRMLIDGGYVNNLPVDEMRKMAPRVSQVVCVDVENKDNSSFEGLAALGDSISGWWLAGRWALSFLRLAPPLRLPPLSEIALKISYISHGMAIRQLLQNRDDSIVYIRPNVGMRFGLLDYHLMGQIVECGLLAANETLDRWDARQRRRVVRQLGRAARQYLRAADAADAARRSGRERTRLLVNIGHATPTLCAVPSCPAAALARSFHLPAAAAAAAASGAPAPLAPVRSSPAAGLPCDAAPPTTPIEEAASDRADHHHATSSTGASKQSSVSFSDATVVTYPVAANVGAELEIAHPGENDSGHGHGDGGVLPALPETPAFATNFAADASPAVESAAAAYYAPVTLLAPHSAATVDSVASGGVVVDAHHLPTHRPYSFGPQTRSSGGGGQGLQHGVVTPSSHAHAGFSVPQSPLLRPATAKLHVVPARGDATTAAAAAYATTSSSPSPPDYATTSSSPSPPDYATTSSSLENDGGAMAAAGRRRLSSSLSEGESMSHSPAGLRLSRASPQPAAAADTGTSLPAPRRHSQDGRGASSIVARLHAPAEALHVASPLGSSASGGTGTAAPSPLAMPDEQAETMEEPPQI